MIEDYPIHSEMPCFVWTFVRVDNDTRIYFDPLPGAEGSSGGGGFKFRCLEWIADTDDGGIASPTCSVATLFHGVAYFDGIRHLHFRDGDEPGNDDGYVYYPNLLQITAALNALRAIELKFCPWAEGHPHPTPSKEGA